jgi:hypothetical protein
MIRDLLCGCKYVPHRPPDPRLTSGGRKRLWLASVVREYVEGLARTA